MKRDNWVLGNGITSGDNALLDNQIPCKVIKIAGGPIKGYELENCLIEVEGEKVAVLGSRLFPIIK